MAPLGAAPYKSRTWPVVAASLLAATVGCSSLNEPDLTQGPFAPGVNQKGKSVDGLTVGNRLMAAGEYELALDAFTRAALDQGMTPEVLSGIGTANLGLGRLGQAEKQLRRAVEEAPEWAEAWNNLGVVLMEQGKTPEATLVFKRAVAVDNGNSDAIRENYRLALAKVEKPDTVTEQKQEYALIRKDRSTFLIKSE